MTPWIRTIRHEELPREQMLEAKGGKTISVCVPARNEERTVAAVVRAIIDPHSLERGGTGLVDEVLVIDDGSEDDTSGAAERAGARVVSMSPGVGKGNAMRAGLEESTGDIVVFLDADVENTSERFVSGLVGPLLLDPQTVLVKGFYERPLDGQPTGGGRVTELVARPVIELLFPELIEVRQPLAGETASHRWVLESIPFADGYGVELGLLVDISRKFGVDSISQVDLGVRVHRNRPLHELRNHARDVLRAALERSPAGIIST